MPDRAAGRRDPRLVAAVALLAGLLAVLVAMVAGVAGDALQRIAAPAPVLRAVLAGTAIVVGVRLLLSALQRIDGSMRPGAGEPGRISDAELGTLFRGVRLVFLAAACF